MQLNFFNHVLANPDRYINNIITNLAKFIPLLIFVKGPSLSIGLWKNSGPRNDVTCVKLSTLGSLSKDDVNQSVAKLSTTSNLCSSCEVIDK